MRGTKFTKLFFKNHFYSEMYIRGIHIPTLDVFFMEIKAILLLTIFSSINIAYITITII